MNKKEKKKKNENFKAACGVQFDAPLVLKPKSSEVVSREYLWDCSSCFNLDFEQCDQIDTDLVIDMSDQSSRSLSNEKDE